MLNLKNRKSKFKEYPRFPIKKPIAHSSKMNLAVVLSSPTLSL
jgi:hypothetical protein